MFELWSNLPITYLEKYERRVLERALELVKGNPSEFNMQPTIDLVQKAFSLGYDVINMTESRNFAEIQSDTYKEP